MNNKIKFLRLLLMISFIFVFVSGCNSNEIKETSIEEEQGNSVSNKIEETISDEDINIDEEEQKLKQLKIKKEN